MNKEKQNSLPAVAIIYLNYTARAVISKFTAVEIAGKGLLDCISSSQERRINAQRNAVAAWVRFALPSTADSLHLRTLPPLPVNHRCNADYNKDRAARALQLVMLYILLA